MKYILALLVILSATLASVALNITDASAVYNPGANVNFVVNVTNSSGDAQSNVTVTPVAGSLSCFTLGTTNALGIATGYCTTTVNTANGSLNLNTTTSPDHGSAVISFTILPINVSVTLTNGPAFNPGSSMTFNATTKYQNGSDVTGISLTANCDGTGASPWSGTCVLASNATAGAATLSVSSANGVGTAAYTVNTVYAAPTVPNTAVSALNKGATTNNAVNMTLANNINSAENYSVSISCPSGLTPSYPATLSNIAASGQHTFNINMTVASPATGTHQCNYTIVAASNASANVSSSFSVNVNPAHNFILASSNSTKTGTPGTVVSYTVTVNNTGEQSQSFSAACSVNDTTYSCAVSSARTVTNGSISDFTVNVTVPVTTNSAAKTITVNVTDPYETKQIPLTLNPGAGYAVRVNTTDNSTTYVASAGATATFTVRINNIANTADTYNVTMTAQDWQDNGTFEAAPFSIMSNATTMTTSSVAANTGFINIVNNVYIPAGTANCVSKTISFTALSTNASSTDSKTITVSTPCFVAAPVVVVNSSSRLLTVNISALTLAGVPVTQASITQMNYTIYQSNGSLVANGTSVILSQVYTHNSTAWAAGNYTLNVSVLTSGMSGTYSSVFFISNAITLTPAVSSFTVTSGSSYNTSVISKLDTGYRVFPTAVSSGGSCLLSILSGSVYDYAMTCYASNTYGYSYNVTLNASISSCAVSGLTCTFNPAFSVATNAVMTITAAIINPPNNNGGITIINPPTTNTTTTNTTTTGNDTTTTGTTTVEVVLPVLINPRGQNDITITNNASTEIAYTATVEEASGFAHFEFTYNATGTIAANSDGTLNLNVQPLPYARPGLYNVTLTINGQTQTIVMVVPQPADNRTVHRYVERSESLNETIVTLHIDNNENVTRTFVINETVPKSVAQNASQLRMLTNGTNYTIIEDDPIVQWVVTVPAGGELDISYKGFYTENLTEFTDPGVGAPLAVSSGTESAGGYDLTWIIVIGAIAALVILLGFFSFQSGDPFFKNKIMSAMPKQSRGERTVMFHKKPEMPKRVEPVQPVKKEITADRYGVRPMQPKKSKEDVMDWITD